MIDKIVALDVETTGLSFDDDDPSTNHQILSIGLIVADGDFNPVDEYYAEIKWNGTSHWNNKAEEIHGLSREYLEEHGKHEGEVATEITEFLLKYFDPEEKIIFLGHNVRSFDIYFFNKLMRKFDFYFRIAHRSIDSFSIGMALFGVSNSDELFNMFYPKRKSHNALEDASMSLGVCRQMRKLMESL